VSREKSEAVYRQISRLLEQEIAQGYAAGDYLPSEHQLAARFSVNRHTVRRAVDELVVAGILERRHGKGTFVVQPALHCTLDQAARLTESLELAGTTLSSHVLDKEIVAAGAHIAQQLGIAEGSPLICVTTLSKADGLPLRLVSHYLARERFDAVYGEYTAGELELFLYERYDVRLTRRYVYVGANLPRAEDAAALRMPRNLPVLEVEALFVDAASGGGVVYSLSRYRADRIRLDI
jgi:GntR family phosphonate transport system transcriptional regulator